MTASEAAKVLPRTLEVSYSAQDFTEVGDVLYLHPSRRYESP